MRHRIPLVAALAIALVSLPAPSQAAQGHFKVSIGTRHATVMLDGNWRRSEIIQDVGRDQFSNHPA